MRLAGNEGPKAHCAGQRAGALQSATTGPHARQRPAAPARRGLRAASWAGPGRCWPQTSSGGAVAAWGRPGRPPAAPALQRRPCRLRRCLHAAAPAAARRWSGRRCHRSAAAAAAAAASHACSRHTHAHEATRRANAHCLTPFTALRAVVRNRKRRLAGCTLAPPCMYHWAASSGRLSHQRERAMQPASVAPMRARLTGPCASDTQ